MSDTLDRREREQWQSALAGAGEGHSRRPECPSPERIWQAAHGELEAAEVRQTLDHAIGCAGCSLAWRLAAEVETNERSPDVGVWPARRSPWRWALPTAAAIVVVALLAPLLLEREQPTDDVVREAPRLAIRSLVEGQTLDRQDCELRWTPVPETTAYSVLVGTEDLDVLLRSVGLTTPELRVPAEALDPLPGGSSLVWRVEAQLEDGGRLSSPSFVNPVQ